MVKSWSVSAAQWFVCRARETKAAGFEAGRAGPPRDRFSAMLVISSRKRAQRATLRVQCELTDDSAFDAGEHLDLLLIRPITLLIPHPSEGPLA